MFVVVGKQFLRYINTAQGCRNKQLKIGVTDIFCINSSNQNSAKCLQGMYVCIRFRYLENKKVSVLSLWNSLEIQRNVAWHVTAMTHMIEKCFTANFPVVNFLIMNENVFIFLKMSNNIP